MGDAMTNAAALDSDTAAYEALAYFSLRPQLLFDAVADVKPTNQTHRGVSVQFFIYDELAAQTSTLDEVTDPTAIAASDSTVIVTPAEKGALLKTTALLRATSLLNVSSDVANLIGFNAGISIDTLARDAFAGGSNVRYSSSTQARTSVTAADKLVAANVRRARVDLANASVMPTMGTMYTAFIHPDVAYDLTTETGAAAWRDPHVYSAPENIWSGEIGAFEGFRFIETPRAPIFADGGSSPTTTDVYATLFCGRQALALAHGNSEGYGRYPTIVRKRGLDYLDRTEGVAWKWFGAYDTFREASTRRVESGSSIGAN